ncbi:MAG: IclR family transcriptional regulator [Desulforhopalus sp.]
MSSSNEINSIVRAAEILKYLSNGISKMTEISRRLEVNKATVHQILKTLESKGLVSQDPASRKYYLGPLIQALAENPMMVHKIVSRLALPEMERLRDLFNEMVVLQIRRGGQRLVLEKVASSQTFSYFPEQKELAPIHAGAAGKVLLSQMHSLQLANLLERLELNKVSINTVTDKKKLALELEEIRTKGYSISISETVTNAAAIAVPLKNYTCPVALAIVGSDDQIIERKEHILNELIKSGEHLSIKMLEVTGIKNAKNNI